MRARLALAASGQVCELREVVLRNKPAELLQASPKGTVPVLLLPDGKVIEQSLDIMLWALAQNDPLGWLPSEPDRRAAMLALIAECDSTFKAGLDRYKYPDRYEGVDPLAQRVLCAEWLLTLETRLAANAGASGAGLCEPQSRLVDAAIMPFVRQFAQVDRAWFDAQPWPFLHAWLAAWLASPLFESVMHKHTPWEGGQGVRFP